MVHFFVPCFLLPPFAFLLSFGAWIETFMREQQVRVKWAAATAIVVCLCVTAMCLAQVSKPSSDKGLGEKEARRLIARLSGVELKTDAVRIKEVSTTGSSAVVVAAVETAFRMVKDDNGKWRAAEVRVGDNRWEEIELLGRAINREKTERARAELETLATALEAFRREQGFYVAASDQSALVDNLSPRYARIIIRVDPWHQPYRYEGTRTNFVLQSSGADGTPGTIDDVTKTSNGSSGNP